MQSYETKSMSEDELSQFKLWLNSRLQTGTVTVTFTKKDGNERVMKCTTDPVMILFKNADLLESKSTPRHSDTALPVYDLEVDGWRSFRWDSIKQVSIESGEYFAYTQPAQ